jgi:hypothetical protein
MTSGAEDLSTANSRIEQNLLGLQLQILTFAYPIDFTFGPKHPEDGRPFASVRLETPFTVSSGESVELIEPGSYGENVARVVGLLWQTLTYARIDSGWLLHLGLGDSTKIDILPGDHVDWEFEDQEGVHSVVAGR